VVPQLDYTNAKGRTWFFSARTPSCLRPAGPAGRVRC